MNRLAAQLPALQSAMVASTAGGPVPPAVVGEVDALIRSISRKARFAEMHMALLTGVDWERIDDIGRKPGGAADRIHLKVPLSEATLVIEHPGAVIDHVYLAFDGLTSALVNMTDTLGRLVNLAYSLGIDQRRATLLAVRDLCVPTSSLGIVLHDVQHTDWLRKVRDLRGRCQHADVEEILTTRAAALSRRGQPYVDQAYSWRSPAQATSIVVYAEEAMHAADGCLEAAMRGILANPGSPMR
jgi:hypothetical protein